MPEHHLTTEQKLLMHFHFIWLATSLYHTGQISCAEVLSLVVMMWRLKVRSADDRHKAAKSVMRSPCLRNQGGRYQCCHVPKFLMLPASPARKLSSETYMPQVCNQ